MNTTIDLTAAPATFDFSGLQATAVGIVGAIIVIVLLVRIGGAYIRRAWGEIVAEVAMVAVIGYFCWFPDSAIETIKGITQTVTGA